ncbi:HAMP domain-containing histidine kinase [Verticiella sediminum]|uniref:histidine kinase n=1 Tax=Verticiella sediminum TaxID=1247510 RepID=A0A556AS38_9BURK|nr:ATP-binding protein [Verticiella sediminum]TSH95730.1 HAMP domain-containing histidine kinase [Verticiella sediminum]
MATPFTDAQSSRASAARDSTGRKNMYQLVQLRWIAVLGQVATICVVQFGFGIHLPANAMLVVLAWLAAFNAVTLLRLRSRREVSNAELLLALLIDVAALTAVLYLSGGASNPFVFLYLLQVILAAVLLRAWSTWVLVAVTALCFAWLAIAAEPLELPLALDQGLASPYILGMWICFILNAVLLVVFVTRISANLRARDARLADLRERAAEEEHVVRLGLLASGAAHELGTPLATLAVILGDWRHLPAFGDPELRQDLDEMQTQVQRCKSILQSILLSAGETRGEAPAATTVHTFLDEVVGEWRSTRHTDTLDYDNDFGPDLSIVSDTALKQVIHNVLDNALEASPARQRLLVKRAGDALVLTVMDEGPGFTPDMLKQVGKPYQSTKGTPGRGLGLFLVLNVARTLGGGLTVSNHAEGGARVQLWLPLTALRLEKNEDVESETA